MSSEPFDVVCSVFLVYFLMCCVLLVTGCFLKITRENTFSPPSEPSLQYIEPQPVLQSPLWQRELPRPREPPEPTYEVLPQHPFIHAPRPYNGLIPRAERRPHRHVPRERHITEMADRERHAILDREDAARRKRDEEELAQYWSSRAMELRAQEDERSQQAINETTQAMPRIVVTDTDGSAHEKPVTIGTPELHVTVDDEKEQSETTNETKTTATTEIDSAGSKELSDDTKTTSHEGTNTVANPEPSQITGTSHAGMTEDSRNEAADTSMMSISSQPIAYEPFAGTTHDSGHETAGKSMMPTTGQPIADEPLAGTAYDSGHETAGISMMPTTQQPIADEHLAGTTPDTRHETAGESMMYGTQQPTTYDPLAGATEHTDSTAAGNSAGVVEEQVAPYEPPANALFQVDNDTACSTLGGWLLDVTRAGQEDIICNKYYFEELQTILRFWLEWITYSNTAGQVVWDLGKLSRDDTKLLKNALEQIKAIVEKHCASINPELVREIVAVFKQLWANNHQAVQHIERSEAEEAERQREEQRFEDERRRREIEEARVQKQIEFEEQQAELKAREAKRQQDLLDKAQRESEEAERKEKQVQMARVEQRLKEAREKEELRNRKQAELLRQQARKQTTQGDAEEEDPWKERDIARKEIAFKEQQKKQQPSQQKPTQPQRDDDEEDLYSISPKAREKLSADFPARNAAQSASNAPPPTKTMSRQLEEEIAAQRKQDAQAASNAKKFTFAQQPTNIPPASQPFATGSFGFGQQSVGFPPASQPFATGSFGFGQQSVGFPSAPPPSATEPFSFGQQPPAFVSAPQLTPQTRRDPIQRNRQQANADRARRNANRPKTTNASQVVPTPPIPAPQNTNASHVAPVSQNPLSLAPDQIPRPLRDSKLAPPQPSAEARLVTPSTSMPDEFLKAMAENLEQTNEIVEHWEQLFRDPSVSGAAPDYKYQCLYVTPGVLGEASKISNDYEWIVDCYTRSNGKGARWWRNVVLDARRVDEAHLLYRIEKAHDFLRKFATETRKYVNDMPHLADLPAILRDAMDMTYMLLECLYKADCVKLRPMEDGDELYYGPGMYESITKQPGFYAVPPRDDKSGSDSSLTSIESEEE